MTFELRPTPWLKPSPPGPPPPQVDLWIMDFRELETRGLDFAEAWAALFVITKGN